jgi:hypothetical protein
MQHSLERKLLYLACLAVFILFGISGLNGYAYVIKEPAPKVNKVVITLLLVIGAAAGWTALVFFRKLFPAGWAKQGKGGRIALSVLFIIFSCGLMYGYGQLLNASIGKQEQFEINGIIERKYMVRHRRSTDYFVVFMDTGSGNSYRFRIREGVFYMLDEEGASVRKTFYRGALGILYRNYP